MRNRKSRPWENEKGKIFPFNFDPKFLSWAASATSTFFNDWLTYYFHTLLKTIKKAILLEITMNPPNAIHFSVNLISKTIFPWQTVKFVFQYCQLNVTKWCSQRVVSNCLWKSTTVQPSNKKWWVLPYKPYFFCKFLIFCFCEKSKNRSTNIKFNFLDFRLLPTVRAVEQAIISLQGALALSPRLG